MGKKLNLNLQVSRKGKRALLGGALFLLFLAAALGFALSGRSDGPITLRVWVESASADDSTIEQAIINAAAAYEAAHQNVRVELEYLPHPVGSSEERQLMVQHIRNEITGGAGPDVFLASTALELNSGWEGVFTDVEGNMRDGLFYDIGRFFDADKDLQGILDPVVMAAGRVGDAQFVLPMWYSYPVIFVDRAAMEEAGLDIGSMCRDTYTLYDTLMASDDLTWIRGLYPSNNAYIFNPFSDIFDYETGSVLLSRDQLADYLGRVEAIYQKSAGSDSFFVRPAASLYTYCSNGTYPLRPYPDSTFPAGFDAHLHAGSLSSVISMVAVAKVCHVDLTAYPLRSIDGDLIANVTYWGAVNANTRHPGEAYDFLRLMLMPEAQSALTECEGWPVRTDVAIDAIWSNYQEPLQIFYQYNSQYESITARTQRLMDLHLTADDFPLTDAEISRARFPTRLEYESRITVFFGEADPETKAEELYESLYWHIGER